MAKSARAVGEGRARGGATASGGLGRGQNVASTAAKPDRKRTPATTSRQYTPRKVRTLRVTTSSPAAYDTSVLTIEIRTNSTARQIVKLKSVFSTPRRLR